MSFARACLALRFVDNSRRSWTPLPPARSSSSLSAPLAAALFHTCRAPRPSSAGGAVVAYARPQGSAACSRSREQGASLFAHVPRSLAPPATSPRRSPQLRFVPADPATHVARKAQETCSLAPKDDPFAREAANGALPCSRTCLVLSLLELPLRAARRSSASSPPSYSSQQRGRRRNCVRSPHGRATCPRSSDCPIILRPLAQRAPSPRRSPQLRFVPAGLLVPAAREAQKLRSLAPRTCSLSEKQ